jgi:ribonuclease E
VTSSKVVETAAARLAHLQQILSAAGLELVQTDEQKLASARAQALSVNPTPRVPRERRPAPSISQEPLVQVETRKEH